MNTSISHDRVEETPEAKARWFQTLSIKERAELLCHFSDLIFAINPNIADNKDAQSIEGRILVLSKA
jgi:hypothetical protein